jgi:hypothetical protein
VHGIYYWYPGRWRSPHPPAACLCVLGGGSAASACEHAEILVHLCGRGLLGIPGLSFCGSNATIINPSSRATGVSCTVVGGDAEVHLPHAYTGKEHEATRQFGSGRMPLSMHPAPRPIRSISREAWRLREAGAPRTTSSRSAASVTSSTRKPRGPCGNDG